MAAQDVVRDNANNSEKPTLGLEESTSDEENDSINEKALLRKLDLQLLPAVGILYLLSFLDRSNGMR